VCVYIYILKYIFYFFKFNPTLKDKSFYLFFYNKETSSLKKKKKLEEKIKVAILIHDG